MAPGKTTTKAPGQTTTDVRTKPSAGKRPKIDRTPSKPKTPAPVASHDEPDPPATTGAPAAEPSNKVAKANPSRAVRAQKRLLGLARSPKPVRMNRKAVMREARATLRTLSKTHGYTDAEKLTFGEKFMRALEQVVPIYLAGVVQRATLATAIRAKVPLAGIVHTNEPQMAYAMLTRQDLAAAALLYDNTMIGQALRDGIKDTKLWLSHAVTSA
jgi:hypothetical protein